PPCRRLYPPACRRLYPLACRRLYPLACRRLYPLVCRRLYPWIATCVATQACNGHCGAVLGSSPDTSRDSTLPLLLDQLDQCPEGTLRVQERHRRAPAPGPGRLVDRPPTGGHVGLQDSGDRRHPVPDVVDPL